MPGLRDLKALKAQRPQSQHRNGVVGLRHYRCDRTLRRGVSSKEEVSLLRFALPASVALTIAVGCGSAEGENSQGQASTPVEQAAETISSPEESVAIIAAAKKDWQERLAANALDDPASHFDNLTKEEFLALARAAGGRLRLSESSKSTGCYRVKRRRWSWSRCGRPRESFRERPPNRYCASSTRRPPVGRGLGWVGVRGLLSRGS